MADNEHALKQESLAADTEKRDLYDEEIRRYKATLNRNLELAFRRYGYSLFHSLPGEDIVKLRSQIGFEPVEASDHYNLGVVAAQEERYTEAAKHFQDALKADPEMANAQFNLALALERAGKKAESRKQWAEFAKRPNLSEEDRLAAEEALKE